MSAFAVFLHQDEPEASNKVRKHIEENFPGSNHYKFSEYVYLVTGPRLVNEVSGALGLDDDDDLYAAVLSLNGSFGGRSWVAMWDWLKAAEKVG
ncbi:MAG: hypothetical protein OXT07_05630 [bacterium]|nr:hypothetical protein [bacterium]